MRQRTRLIVNSLANTAARVVAFAVRFLLVPFMIGVMGREHYGVWIVLGQIFAYTRILDMGLRSAIGREVALRLSTAEPDRINRYVNTAAAYYSVAGLLIVVMTGIVAYFFPDWFDVEPQYRWASRIMVICCGLAMAGLIPQNAYGAVVSGLQRYDILSGLQILVAIFRAVLIFALLERLGVGGGLILVAAVEGGTRLAGAVAGTLAALRLCPPVKWQPWCADRSLLRDMLSFGINSVVFMMALTVGSQLAQILIGAYMSTAQAADFSVALMFLVAGHSFVVMFGISTRVVASKFEGENNVKAIRHLLLRSSLYSGLMSVAGVVMMLLFADALLRLWVGGTYAGPGGALALERITGTFRILAIGYGLFWIVLPAYNVVNGMGRHRFPAIVAVASGVISMVLVAIVVSATGATIELVAWAVIVPMIPAWGLILPWYCCKEVGQPLGRFVWEGFGIPALTCLPMALAAFIFNYWYPATGWGALLGQLSCCGMILLSVAWLFAVAPDDRRYAVDSVRGLLRRLKGN